MILVIINTLKEFEKKIIRTYIVNSIYVIRSVWTFDNKFLVVDFICVISDKR